jgi:isopentenyldiphosphate isomerase
MRAQRLRHRTVFVAVQATDGRLLVHRRSLAKDIWPGWWDLSVGGVVTAGEDWLPAACREVAEEIGVTVAPDDLVALTDGLVTYADDSVALVGRVYRVVHDGPFTFADGEVLEARWVTGAELDDLRSRVPFLPDGLALVLPLLDIVR